MIYIIPTTAAEHLGKRLQTNRDFKVKFIDMNKDGKRFFPDDEVYVRLSRFREDSDRAIVLHAGAPKPDKGLMELKMVLEILNEKNVRSIEVFFTYFPYGMQDKRFRGGEANVAENLIKELVEYYKVKKIYIIDSHFKGRRWVKKYPIKDIPVMPLLKQAAKKDFPGVIFQGPDLGATRRFNVKGTKMKRLDSHHKNVRSDKKFKDTVCNQYIGCEDDIIETGGTMVEFYDECKKCGSKDIVALITHGVLSKGIKRVKSKYSKLYLSNTINRREANIDITNEIIKAIKNK